MAGIKKRLGSLLGPEGRAPQIIEGQTTSVAPHDPVRLSLVKISSAKYRVDAEVPRGLDGDPTAVANLGQAMAAEITTDGSTGHTALANVLSTDSTIRQIVEESVVRSYQPSRADQVVLRNELSTRPNRKVDLITGDPGESAVGFAGMNLSHNTDPEFAINPKGSWKIEADTVARVDVRDLEATPGPVTALGVWVYLTDASVVNFVRLATYSSEGVWQRNSSDSGSNLYSHNRSLKNGWNFIRFQSTAGELNNLTTINRAQIVANITAPTVLYVGHVFMETRPKATALFVNDWGSKTFLDLGYPDMVARGFPVTWALRVSRLGQGSYPNAHISLQEAQQVAQENNNEVGLHSWDGSSNEQTSDEHNFQMALKAIAGIQAKGMSGPGTTWRPAWVQNNAQNTRLTETLFAAAGTHSQSIGSTVWPPHNRYNIPRVNVHRRDTAYFDDLFDILKKTHNVAIFYTHAVGVDNDPNHATQAEWDDFISHIDQAVSEGWLELLSFSQLISRDRLEDDERMPLYVTQHGAEVEDTDTVPSPDPINNILVTGEDDVTPGAFSGMTVTHAGILEDRPAWRIDTETGGACRLDVPVLDGPVTPPDPEVISVWIYVTDPNVADTVRLYLRSASGDWVRGTEQSGFESGWPLSVGWNELRWLASSADPSLLQGIHSVTVLFTGTDSATLYVGSVSIESTD